MIYLACPSVPGCFKIVNCVAAYYFYHKQLVFSPLSHSIPIAKASQLPFDWNFWKDFNLEMLSKCTRLDVIDIDGIENSVGVAAEITYAEEKGIPIQYHKALWQPINSFGEKKESTRERVDGYNLYLCHVGELTTIYVDKNDLL